MPIKIVLKPKAEPKVASQHKNLVPLRCVGIDNVHERIVVSDYVEVDDILFIMPSKTHADTLFNATKESTIPSSLEGYINLVRDYTIQSITLFNDSDPAPTL